MLNSIIRFALRYRVLVVFVSLALLLYGGFVLLNAFWPEIMEYTPLAGVNLAIWYGFGLIVAALVLALIYGRWGTAASGDREGRA